MSMNHEAWLDQTREDALEAELEICDPHHHLWHREGDDYLLDDLLRDTGSGHKVVSTVFVECRSAYREDGPIHLQPVGETEFVEGVARSSLEIEPPATAVAAGIVGLADLHLGDAVAVVLEAHLEASPLRFRGIRHASGWDPSPEVRSSHTDPPPGLLLDAKFRVGFEWLERYGLSFDAWHYHTQIDELTDLAHTFPRVKIVLDHVGGPLGIGPYAGRRDEVYRSWQKSISDLASCDNVVVKLGGLAMPICGFDWHECPAPPSSQQLAQAWAPYLYHCIDVFGVDRCMFESNFPVDKRSCSYTVLWNAFKRLAADFSDDDKASLFHDTAAREYRIGTREP